MTMCRPIVEVPKGIKASWRTKTESMSRCADVPMSPSYCEGPGTFLMCRVRRHSGGVRGGLLFFGTAHHQVPSPPVRGGLDERFQGVASFVTVVDSTHPAARVAVLSNDWRRSRNRAGVQLPTLAPGQIHCQAVTNAVLMPC